MQNQYQLPAGAMLYAVYLLHKRGIYGLPPAMPSLKDKDFPAFAQAAEQQLLAAGLAGMDFSGSVTLDADFAALLAACADCTGVTGAAVRCGGRQLVYTLYPAGALLCREEDNTCTLTAAPDPAAALLEALALPDADSAAEALLLDTDLLEKADREAMLAAGCTEAAADLILDGLAGSGNYAHITCTRDRERIAEAVLLYGAGGIYRADAEYTLTQELLRFTPFNKPQAEAVVQALVLAAALLPEAEDDPEDDTVPNGPENLPFEEEKGEDA